MIRDAALAAYQADADLDRARERLGAALPHAGWIDEYLRAVVPLTDAPVEFSLAAGLCALSAALGNSLWYDSWGQHVYPHLWAILVAPSSFWRKSTAINMAERVLRHADNTRVLPTDFSREKLLEELQARPVGMLTLKEFGGFLANISRDYMGGTKEMLTELYDGPDQYVRALKKQNYVVEKPAITLLGATTLDWLESRVTDGDLRGGFLGRFLFVTATERSTPKGLTDDMDYGVRMRLGDALRDLTKVTPGKATFTAEGRQLLDAWLESWEDEVTSSHHSTDLTGFAVRLQTYAIKLAMVYQASHVMVDGKPVDQLDGDSVRSAIALCRLLWQNVSKLVDQEIAIGKDAKELRRLTGMVGAGISRSDLLKLSKLKGRDFDEYLATLEKSDQIELLTKLPAELGLVRKTNRPIQWITLKGSHGSRNGSSKTLDAAAHFPLGSPDLPNGSVPFEFPELRENREMGNPEGSESELSGAVLSTESPLTSPLSHLPRSHDESAGATRRRARGTENRELKNAEPTPAPDTDVKPPTARSRRKAAEPPPAEDDDSRWDVSS